MNLLYSLVWLLTQRLYLIYFAVLSLVDLINPLHFVHICRLDKVTASKPCYAASSSWNALWAEVKMFIPFILFIFNTHKSSFFSTFAL